MKLDSLNTATPAEEGRLCQFKHPAFGHLLWTGPGANPDGSRGEEGDVEPVGAIIRGWHSDTVQALIRKHAKAQLRDGKDVIDEETAGRQLAQALVVRFVGIEDGDEPLKADKDGIEKLFKNTPQFQAQILAFSKDASRFFTKQPTD